MAEKLPPCCARHQSRITHEKGAVAAAARSAARAATKRPERMAYWQARIALAKSALTSTEAAYHDHLAEHAGEDR